VKHLLKERKGKDVVAKCLAKPTVEETTAWWTDVTCPECQHLIHYENWRDQFVRHDCRVCGALATIIEDDGWACDEHRVRPTRRLVRKRRV